MKPFIFAFLLGPLLLPLHADDWLTNGDFSAGKDKWYGEAKWPDDFTNTNDPFAKPDPFTAAGMILPLKSSVWLKEFQDFKGKGTNATLKITYQLSPDCEFSKKAEDYKNMPDKIGWDAWKAFDTPPDTFVIFISELESRSGEYYLISPKLNEPGDQTFTASISGMTAHTNKTMAIAIPPGKGMIVIKKVEMQDADSK